MAAKVSDYRSAKHALKITISSTSARTTPNTSFGTILKMHWPSPHTSTLQVTSMGSLRTPIMYPGAKTMASSRLSSGISFNMQYLQLQNEMQQENRKFSVLSNIMKTKHDTAKNAINNVR
jgi:hypothetical protein